MYKTPLITFQFYFFILLLIIYDLLHRDFFYIYIDSRCDILSKNKMEH